MTVDIKTAVLHPKRHTFTHIAKRLGGDKPASRYDEGTMDIQAETHFHYRPLWAPQFELYDKNRTKIVMRDWYALRDPRQFYYANYNITRAGQIESAEHSFAMVEKRGLLAAIPADWVEQVVFYLLPLRHYEWGANMNNCQITNFGYGTALTAATTFAMGDRLGIAQLIGRIGLAIGNNAEGALTRAKSLWMEHPDWQNARRLVEDTLVLQDPIEIFIAQNLALDGIVYPLVYGNFAQESDRRGGAALSFLCAFQNEWWDEISRWVDAVTRTMAAESPENKAILTEWLNRWSGRAAEAFAPIATHVLGTEAGTSAIGDVSGALAARATKLGVG